MRTERKSVAPFHPPLISPRLRHGNKQKVAYLEGGIRFLSVVAEMIASALDDAINFDASRRKQDELRLKRSQLQFLLELSGQITLSLELRELLRALSRTARGITPCDAVVVHLHDEAPQSVLCCARLKPLPPEIPPY